jgi:hypothetical protein
MDKLKFKDPNEMYLRAKGSSNRGHEIQFYEFFEWIHNDINRLVYGKTNNSSNSSVKTGLESANKFQPRIGQIKFSKDGVSTIGSDKD